MSQNDIFAIPDRDTSRAQVDDKSLSFEEKWNSLANDYFNATDFDPENSLAEMDPQIVEVVPRMPPAVVWTGEQVRKHFSPLRT
jgi:hypothetical protein